MAEETPGFYKGHVAHDFRVWQFSGENGTHKNAVVEQHWTTERAWNMAEETPGFYKGHVAHDFRVWQLAGENGTHKNAVVEQHWTTGGQIGRNDTCARL